MSSPLPSPPWRQLRLESVRPDRAEVYIPLERSGTRSAAHLLAQAQALCDNFARSNKGSIAWKRNEGDIRKLIKYWAHGEGAAKIGWGKPCDFCSCVNHLRKYIPGDHEVKGFCARLHRRATGKWPGPRSKGKHCPC